MSGKLTTVQYKGSLNDVYRAAEKGVGNAYHEYVIQTNDNDEPIELARIKFQQGARQEPGSELGVIDSDLLEIVRDRLKLFQEGEFECTENAMALVHIETAIMWLNRRVEDRIKRDVIGTHNK
ncbi:ABC transporter ATPase [Acetobacterium sp.]|uniref:ABC transporter ATPase n=1 Tax=Acetobacterium sp. TaxID=1872094 RepID=UPI002F41163C